jgi:hypothetical protein
MVLVAFVRYVAMNKANRREFVKRFDDPAFRVMFGKLVALRTAYPNVAVTRVTPTAKQVRDGVPGRILVAGCNGLTTEAAIPIAQVLIREVLFRSRMLAAYFPEPSRWHWEEVFLTIGLNGTGEVRQQQRGGRPKETTDRPKSHNDWIALAKGYYHASQSSGISMNDYSREVGVNSRTVRRAVTYAEGYARSVRSKSVLDLQIEDK